MLRQARGSMFTDGPCERKPPDVSNLDLGGDRAAAAILCRRLPMKFYDVAMAGGVRAGNGLVLAEGIWKRLRRPYDQVYPVIIPALLNLRLDIQTS